MSLFSALSSSANTLSAFEKALSTIQNNVANASTPGYAVQSPSFQALPFNAANGEMGGVTAGPLIDSRDQYAEQNVRSANSQLGSYEQQVQSLTDLQNQFDISGNTGVPSALNTLSGAFSDWSTNPNSPTARDGVISAAGSVADAFRQTASNVANIASSTKAQIGTLVNQVNSYASQLAGYNAKIEGGDHNDPNMDAAINNTLQNLSEIVNVTASRQSNGTIEVALGGQTNLVSGSSTNPIAISTSSKPGLSATSGAPVSTPVSITTGTNNALNLEVDGSPLSTIHLNQSDTTLSSVVSDINTQLKAAGSTATASQDAQGRLVITSGSSGANASVQIEAGSANTTLGLIPSTAASMHLTNSNGLDVTGTVTQGKLAGALQVANEVLPAIQGDASHSGSLNQLAAAFASRVNSLVGTNIFNYDQTDSSNVAQSLQLNPSVTSANLPTSQVTALTGTAVTAPIAITTGTNDKLNLSVDGKTWPSITLNPADTSLSAVAADLNGQFTTLGIGATASINGNTGALVLSTNGTGNTSSIQILSGSSNATLGLSSTSPTYQNGANAAALSLASLASSSNPLDQINGQNYSSFFGSIAAGIGSQLASATTGQTAQQDMLTQSESIRQQVSGVDLNTEATQLITLQTSYQAASKLITVIDSMTQTVLSLITS